MLAALGLGVGGCGRLGDAISGGFSARDCHPDPKTVAALRKEPVSTQTPAGASATVVTDTLSCGWVDPTPINLGMLDREVTGAGAADAVSRFYTDLGRSSGWEAFDQSIHVYDATKPDGSNCTWHLYVLNTAEGTYHVQITYTPRDLRPTCL
ncbi:hypothetical protein GA0074695_1199 [Micromonospora viridifaciens]|uniref:Uncharacterized protein n=1 Tax=Micromonospora viridifaciens TaxID=1881 RepID=A0A1C4V6W2_MICVI|nr:hypothetical protein [Micromonospora viridifaciens]SCE79738.1 hypothetical protein GA0074695_1199 [Micromonospora viridifaciens]